MKTSRPSLSSAIWGEDGAYPVKYERAWRVASVSCPAKAVVSRSGRVGWRSASATAGRALRAAHPHTEFTTTSVVPGVCSSAASTASGVRNSSIPRRVNSWRIGATKRSSYMLMSFLVWVMPCEKITRGGRRTFPWLRGRLVRPSEAEGGRERLGGRCDEGSVGAELRRELGVLEPVPGTDADGSARPPDPPGGDARPERGHPGGRGRLTEDPLPRGDRAIGVEYGRVRNGAKFAAGLARGLYRAVPARGAADPDRARDRLRLRHRMAEHERRCAGGLTAEDRREGGRPSQGSISAKARPVGRDVAAVADRKREHVRGAPQRVADLVGRRRLTGDAVRVDGVDERHRVVGRQRPGRIEGGVEPAVDRDRPRAIGERLRDLRARDPAAREENHGLHTGPRRVRRRTGRRVAGRGAQQRARARLDRPGDRHDHAAILERSRGVRSLELDP